MLEKSKPDSLNDYGAGILSDESRRQIEEFDKVELSPEVRAELLDPEAWAAILSAYAKAMKMAVALTDTDSRRMGICNNPQPVWLLVNGAKSDPAGCSFCLGFGSPCTAVKDALRNDKVTLTRDGAGLAHVAVPLVFRNRQLGALIAGQVFNRYPEPLLLRRLARDLELPEQQLWNVAVTQVPVNDAALYTCGALLQTLGEAFVQQRYAILLARHLKESTYSLAKSNEALARANDEVQQFAYSARHDLQEPLRTVAIYGQLLQKTCAGKIGVEADEFIEHMIEASKRMGLLVRDLLAYTSAVKDSEPQRTAVDANLVLETVLGALAVAILEHAAVVAHENLPSVPMLHVHLQQIFQNLIGNALKYRSSEEPPRIHISAEQKGSSFIFSVADNGIGIDPRYADRVFGIFKRLHTKEKYTGTGIGLAICKKIVEHYGGRIWVESELDKGSTFRFELPAQSENI